MKVLSILFAALLLFVAGPTAADSTPGKMTGGVAYSLPSWFKASFMDLRADVKEARARGRQVMVFLHMEQCPYCARMLQESFAAGDNRAFIEKHFDVIGLDVQWSLDVTWTDGATLTEKALAQRLGAFATPTVVLLDRDGNKVLQLTGYRDAGALRDALEYVANGRFRTQTFAAYAAARKKPATYTLREHPQFSAATDLKGYRKPLAILFEDRRCAQCARFHDRTLNRPDVAEEMKKFLFVRLDAESDQPIVDLDGRRTTPARWAKALDLTYRPSIVLFNEGREIFRADGLLYYFHFTEALRYVSGGHYKKFGSISNYRAAYRAELLRKGIDIDVGE
jgi:thioredoxin-related protein